MHTLTLPRLGQTMQAGTVVEWLVAEGQAFDVGDELYSVETEKATVEVEATLSGTMARIVVPEGKEVPVGTLLAVVADSGETVTAAEVDAIVDGSTAGAQPPLAREPAASQEPPIARERPGEGRVRGMPRAKRLAAELGVDLSSLQGTGHEGAITEEDVRRAGASTPRVLERRPLRGIARAQAEQLTRSWQIPQFSQDLAVDMGNLQARRSALREAGEDVTVTDLLIDAVVKGVAEAPLVNSSLAGDEIVVYASVNVSVAVATEAGLVVPVLRSCERKDVATRARELASLAERARSGRLTLDDSAGGTVTVSNLGMTGVETGIPLVHAPQACIVFAGATLDQPVVRGGSLAIGPVMHLVTAFDHRIVDGITAARFSIAVRAALEAA